MSKNLKVATFVIFVSSFAETTFAQQWSGPNDQTGTISRTGPITTGNIVSTGTIQSSNAGLRIGLSTIGVAGDGFSLYLKALGNTYLNTSNSAYVTNSGNIILTPNGGNLGIGTLTPVSKLHVAGAVGASPSLLIQNDSYNSTNTSGTVALQFGFANHGAAKIEAFKQTVNTTGLNFYTEYGYNVSQLAMSITSTGNVGIGTVASLNKLQIGSNPQGWNENDLVISNSSNSLAIHNTSEHTYLYGSGDIAIRPGFGQMAVYAKANGNVGIGTTTPDAKLAVKGAIHAQEVRVDLNGAVAPDYVFESDYSLMPLDELKTYLDTNKHLPEVPSAKEMEANGVNLKEINLLLLKKVEELTLYVIELKKRDEDQQKEMEEIIRENKLVVKKLNKK
jgi:hypothetical protein